MYSNPISASNGTATVNFDLRGASLENSEYKDASAPLDLPHKLSIRHQTTNKGKVTQTRRSVIRIDRTVEDDLGNQADLSVYLVVAVPEKLATTEAVTEQVTLMKNHLAASGVIAKVVAAEL